MAEVMVESDREPCPPRRVTAAHSLILDLQEAVLPIDRGLWEEPEELLVWFA